MTEHDKSGFMTRLRSWFSRSRPGGDVEPSGPPSATGTEYPVPAHLMTAYSEIIVRAQAGPARHILYMRDSTGICRHEERCTIDYWVMMTKFRIRMTAVILVPTMEDFLSFLRIQKEDVLEGANAHLSEMENMRDYRSGVTKSLLANLWQTVQTDDELRPRYNDIIQDLQRRATDELTRLVSQMILSCELQGDDEGAPRTCLLVGGKDLLAITSFNGSQARLRTILPVRSYEEYVQLLTHRNPYVVNAKRNGHMHRSFVHLVLCRQGLRIEPGLTIAPLPTCGTSFGTLFPTDLMEKQD